MLRPVLLMNQIGTSVRSVIKKVTVQLFNGFSFPFPPSSIAIEVVGPLSPGQHPPSSTVPRCRR